MAQQKECYQCKYIRCDICPYCKDLYPDRVDSDGNQFQICGMTGNGASRKYLDVGGSITGSAPASCSRPLMRF